MRTIKSSADIERLFRSGERLPHRLVVALIARTPEGRGPGGRVAFVAGKKLGGAVRRNRAKRVLRHAALRAGAPWAGLDVALVARAGVGAAVPAQVDEALKAVAERAGELQ